MDKLDIILEEVRGIRIDMKDHGERITKIESSYFNEGNGIKAKVEKMDKIHSDCFGNNGGFWGSFFAQLNQASALLIAIVIIVGLVVVKYI